MSNDLQQIIALLKHRATNLNIQGQLAVSLEVTNIVHILEDLIKANKESEGTNE